MQLLMPARITIKAEFNSQHINKMGDTKFIHRNVKNSLDHYLQYLMAQSNMNEPSRESKCRMKILGSSAQDQKQSKAGHQEIERPRRCMSHF